MSVVRRNMWKAKTAKANMVSAPKLISLPPSNQSFQLNVLIVSLQTCDWRHGSEGDLCEMDPNKHRWLSDTVNKSLQSIMISPDTAVAQQRLITDVLFYHSNFIYLISLPHSQSVNF
jgi:hypothetical protein